LTATNVTKDGLKLHWQQPEDDGGCPILEYEVEKQDIATGKWVRVGKCPGHLEKPTIDVTGLEQGHEYKFRVVAVNSEGDSEPLVTEKAIVAKNPFGKTRFRDFFIVLAMHGKGIYQLVTPQWFHIPWAFISQRIFRLC